MSILSHSVWVLLLVSIAAKSQTADSKDRTPKSCIPALVGNSKLSDLVDNAQRDILGAFLMNPLIRKDRRRSIQWRGPSLPAQYEDSNLPNRQALNARNLNEAGEDVALREILFVFSRIAQELGVRNLTHSARWRGIQGILVKAIHAQNLELVRSKLEEVQLKVSELLSETNTIRIRKVQDVEAKADKIDWPRNGLPMAPRELIDSTLDAIEQAYKIDASEVQVVRQILVSYLPKFFLFGQSFFLKTYNYFGRFQATLGLTLQLTSTILRQGGSRDEVQENLISLAQFFSRAADGER